MNVKFSSIIITKIAEHCIFYDKVQRTSRELIILEALECMVLADW